MLGSGSKAITRRQFLRRGGIAAGVVGASLFGGRAPLHARGLRSSRPGVPPPPGPGGGPACFTDALQFPLWGDAAFWNRPQYYSTILLADIDGDGKLELVARGPAGLIAHRFDAEVGQWEPLPGILSAWSDAGGWNLPQYYSTIQAADIDGDTRAELIGRSSRGIETWKYDGGQWVTVGPDIGIGLADAVGWAHPQYYSTIRLADVDGDGQAELVARSIPGIGTWKYDRTSAQWIQVVPSGGIGLADSVGWDQVQYYSTIRLADIDGQGDAELLARGADGVHAWKYDATNPQWIPLEGVIPWSDEPGGWAHPQYYSTIRTASIDGLTPQTVLARGFLGIETWKYDFNKRDWVRVPGFVDWGDPQGWDAVSRYSTIRLADIDGDGKDELIGRGPGGVEVWGYDTDIQDWLPLEGTIPLTDALGWNRPEYYETIRVGDVNHDRHARLISRSGLCLLTWGYDPGAEAWSLTSAASTPFPAFTGTGQQAAYTYISQQLDSGSDVRSRYTDLALNVSAFPTIQRPAQIGQADWNAVYSQLQSELSYLGDVNRWFTLLGQLTTNTFSSQSLSVQTVADILALPTSSSASVGFTVVSLLANGAWAALGVVDPAASAVAGLLATVFAAVNVPGGGGSVSTEVVALQETLNQQFLGLQTANGCLQSRIVQSWSLLRGFGRPIDEGTLQWDDTLSGSLLAATVRGYEISLWQILTPLVWAIIVCNNVTGDCSAPDGYPSRYVLTDGNTQSWIQVSGSTAGPAVEALDRLFQQLGVPLADVILGQHGWNVPIGL